MVRLKHGKDMHQYMLCTVAQPHKHASCIFEPVCSEAIVTEMVRLKHGKDAIISNKLVAEANVSLSEWPKRMQWHGASDVLRLSCHVTQ
eukprot:1158417-Pelagomonas_calceolata.AAC.4